MAGPVSASITNEVAEGTIFSHVVSQRCPCHIPQVRECSLHGLLGYKTSGAVTTLGT